MKPIVPMSTWLSLPKETRNELRRIFSIPLSGGFEVVDGHVASDGTFPRDLQVVTLEALQDVLDSDSTNFFELFQEMVDTIENKEVKVDDITKMIEEKAKPEETELTKPNKRKYVKKVK